VSRGNIGYRNEISGWLSGRLSISLAHCSRTSQRFVWDVHNSYLYKLQRSSRLQVHSKITDKYIIRHASHKLVASIVLRRYCNSASRSIKYVSAAKSEVGLSRNSNIGQIRYASTYEDIDARAVWLP